MTAVKSWHIVCDLCGVRQPPTGTLLPSSARARRAARRDGWHRKRVLRTILPDDTPVTQLVDLCPACSPLVEEVAP